MNGRWAIGYVLATAMFLSAMRTVTPPRWWRRAMLRRELKGHAQYRRRIRRTAERIEADLRAAQRGHPSAVDLDREQLGRELAACAVLLVDVDAMIDHDLDQLDALR